MGGKKEWVKDLFFPKFCISCKQEGFWVCRICKPCEIVVRDIIGIESSYLDRVVALCEYADNALSELVKLLKYNCIEEVIIEMREILVSAQIDCDWRGAVLVPVPLHPRRERERGFNQARVIARIFADIYHVPLVDIVRRVVYTAQQARLSAVRRRENMSDVFSFIFGSVVPQKVILVDDIYTTGSTMRECARVLRDAGVERISGLVIATGAVTAT